MAEMETDICLKLITNLQEYNRAPIMENEQLLNHLKRIKWLMESCNNSDRMCNLSKIIVQLEDVSINDKSDNSNPVIEVEIKDINKNCEMLVVPSRDIENILKRTNVVEDCINVLKIAIEFLINRICNNCSIEDALDIQRTAVELTDCLSVFEKHELFQPHVINMESLIGSMINKFLNILVTDFLLEMLPLKVYIYHMVNAHLVNLAKINPKYSMLILRSISEKLSNLVDCLEEIEVGTHGAIMETVGYCLRLLKKVLCSHVSPDCYKNSEFVEVVDFIRTKVRICAQSERFSQYLRVLFNMTANCCQKFLMQVSYYNKSILDN